jgi:YHS domain-containing protein
MFRRRRHRAATESAEITVRDPVCGMEISERDVAGRSDYHGLTYFFCSAACKETFDAKPESYVR